MEINTFLIIIIIIILLFVLFVDNDNSTEKIIKYNTISPSNTYMDPWILPAPRIINRHHGCRHNNCHRRNRRWDRHWRRGHREKDRKSINDKKFFKKFDQ